MTQENTKKKEIPECGIEGCQTDHSIPAQLESVKASNPKHQLAIDNLMKYYEIPILKSITPEIRVLMRLACRGVLEEFMQQFGDSIKSIIQDPAAIDDLLRDYGWKGDYS